MQVSRWAGDETNRTVGLKLRSLLVAYQVRRIVLGLIVVLAVSIGAGGIGSVYVSPDDFVKIVIERVPFIDISTTWPSSWETIIWDLRLPRIVLAGLVGSALAIAGATYQGLFRNPLADPYLIGVASGAGLGAAVIFLTGLPFYFGGISLLPLAAFAGGLGAVTVAYVIARQSDGVPLTTLILAGVAISSMAGALTSLLMMQSDPDVRPLLGWLLGGFNGASWVDVKVLIIYITPAIAVMIAYGRMLNLLQLNEDEAKQLGVNVERSKLLLVALASLTTAAAVSVSGMIGFVGLIAPHAVRLIWGYDHRTILPMAMLMGAGFLVVADVVARTIVSPSELPVGVVTAFCGGPFFLYLLRHRGQTLS